MDESGKVIAKWDAAAARIYNEICVEEVNAHNRSQHFLNAEGYANLIMKFKERTGRTYTIDQMKNRWNTLKRMYIQWKILNERATGLVRDPHIGSISGTDEWWARQNESMPGCLIFKNAPLENENELRIMFGPLMSQPPVPGEAPKDAASSSDDDEDDDASLVGEYHDSPKSKKRKALKDEYMKRIVEAFETRIASSIKTKSDPVREEIASQLKTVIDDGNAEGSDEHFFATQLLIEKRYRDVFASLKTKEGRVSWLRRAYERIDRSNK